ncbi:hypothetical protein FRC09_009979, partial [Ceratobasidium sp. 395]
MSSHQDEVGPTLRASSYTLTRGTSLSAPNADTGTTWQTASTAESRSAVSRKQQTKQPALRCVSSRSTTFGVVGVTPSTLGLVRSGR